MLQKSTLDFLKHLKKNNSKEWFDKNRKNYEVAKSDFSSFINNLIRSTALFDDTLISLEAKNCIFRINRDIRFGKDKSPYKINMGASITAGGKKISAAGYYFHCEPGNSFLAGGFYMPMPPQLTQIRQEIDYNFDSWKKIISDKKFKKYFPEGIEGVETLSRPPKGYDEDNPAIEYLKMKGFIVSHALSDTDLTDKTLLKKTLQYFEAMKPLIWFLNEATL